MNTEPLSVRLRIVVVAPPDGVQWRLQLGRDGLAELVRETDGEIAFEFALRVGPPRDGHPNFLGAAAQGPADGRFVYINSGRRAGVANSGWDRRAKVPLRGIDAGLLEQALTSGGLLEAKFAGTGKDGGPACATVPLSSAWRVVH